MSAYETMPDDDLGSDPRNPPNAFFQASMAISLKRIADALAGNDQNTGIREALCYIEEAIRTGGK